MRVQDAMIEVLRIWLDLDTEQSNWTFDPVREQDIDVAAAARRDIGNTPAAQPRHEPYDRLGLGADLGCGVGTTFMAVLDKSISSVNAGEAPPSGRSKTGALG